MANMAAYVDRIIQRCSSLAHVGQIQGHLIATGLFVASPPSRVKLLELCALSHSLVYAHHLFDGIPHPLLTTNDYNAILRGIAAASDPSPALPLYSSLLRRRASPSSPRPDALTLSFTLRASARLSHLPSSLLLHTHIVKFGCFADTILATTLLDCYCKSRELGLAHKIFDEMLVRDTATYNVLIAGLASGDRPRDALRLFRQVPNPNPVTVIAALSACAQLGAPGEGEAIHAAARSGGLDSVEVLNALIDMYAKCGSIDRAVETFRSIPSKTLVSYNSLIMGLAIHGHGARALELFYEMVGGGGGILPDSVSYLAALSGCNHAGLVEEGLSVFESMKIPPNVKHYGCVADMLGRAGRVQEAYDAIASMPFEPDAVMWQTLLGACKTYGNVDLAERASEKLMAMGSNGDGDFVLLSNVYAAKARWSDVKRVREDMVSMDVRKVPGFSFVELDDGDQTVHKFLNGDKEHPRWEEIYEKLDEIIARISALGYKPETRNVLHDIGEEDKEGALRCHSEKLAVAFGLLATPAGTALQVSKNLRICGDCHSAAKLVSRAFERVIVIRDRMRFHRFEGGECSCGDYW